MAPQAYNSRILEIKLISAQDLSPLSESMKTYAVAWVNPGRKLTTRVDETNHTNPVWNDKFVFRIDDKFFNDEESAIMIDIYAAAWGKDALIGTVRVFIGDLFSDFHKSSSMRFVSLQVRRPSGRPQGMLSMGVSLLDSTLRSMPMFTDLTTTNGFHDSRSPKQNKANKATKLRRLNSDRTDLTTSDDYYYPPGGNVASSVCTGSTYTVKGGAESACNGSTYTVNGGAGGSMVNGSLCYSDVGPSASVVAAAIAKGLYYHPKPKNNREDTGSLILADNEEGVKAKLERWRTEALYEHQRKYSKMASVKHSVKLSVSDDHSSNSKSERKRRRRRRRNGKGLFSCFGKVFGLEISITCGGSNGSNKKHKKNKKKNSTSNKVFNLSSVDDTYSSYV